MKLIFVTFLIIPILFTNCYLDSKETGKQNTFNVQPTIKDKAEQRISPLDIRYYPDITVVAFYRALKTKNRQVALKLAPNEVVEKLLEDRAMKVKWHFSSCENTRNGKLGDIICFFDFQGGGIGIFLRIDEDGKHRIVSTYFMGP